MTIINALPDDFVLLAGKHNSFDDGACLLEMVAYVAGEPHTDHPECVCPVLAAFGRAWNDGLGEEPRTRLLGPFITRLIDTRSTLDVQVARACLAADWLVRTHTPAWLRLAGLDDDAASLEQLPALSSAERCSTAMPAINDAGEAAYAANAKYAVPGSRQRAAGAVAVAAAANAAAYTADANAAAYTVAANAAAYAVAVDAAVDAAVNAANAARDACSSTVVELQASAVDLYNRMINLTEVA